MVRTLEVRHQQLMHDIADCEKAIGALNRIRRTVGEEPENPIDEDTGTAMSDDRRTAVWACCLPVADRVCGAAVLPAVRPRQPPPSRNEPPIGPSGQA